MSELQPADFERADYRTVLRRLTTLDQRAADLRAEAVEWHAEQRAAADEQVAAAEEQARAAQRAVRAAQRDLEEVDARAAGLWAEYVHRVGPVAERFGKLPPASIPRQRSELEAEDYLAEVEKKVKWTPPARPITFGVKVLFWIFGLAGGIVGALLNQVLRDTGAVSTGDWHQAAPVVALLVLLACPVLAVVGAKLVADRRKVGLDTATVVTILVTGLVTAMLLFTATQYASGGR
ncbi:tetrahydromethanopterin S-methyltransferase subunit G [Actinoplanes octamycinicus]|uniref:Tetrahydromethanopterin S-methyltransferase subunit G n=1 Tax=Actinoplanes octamycinicus TaxID=135948 RepID=A0A7W7H5R1_9ACTN|nr:hypothetical protein [Actinoplanes octamycinicus]MBB4744530.1 tetrahydromethanopterin S-methyltransferase subunit G [Actinoplanes octamycinicus]GIE61550.1 hypothetical protein Aoc01nite_69520 [Actinoplanes octamycinicus]